MSGGKPIFVKRTLETEIGKNLRVMRAADGVPEIPKSLGVAECPEAKKGEKYLCVEWCGGRRVPLPEMNAKQWENLLAAYARLEMVLREVTEGLPAVRYDDPGRHYDALKNYANRHPIAARWLKVLLDLPFEERSLEGHRLSTIHGDFHANNYSFDGDCVAYFYDFDSLCRGLPCEDVLRPFIDCYRSARLSRNRRERVEGMLTQAIRIFSWSKIEWKVALNSSRLYAAARHFPPIKRAKWYTAFEIYWKDRWLRRLLRIIDEA